jgi:hypothetical protein
METPQTVRALGVVLWIQAAFYVLSTLVAVITYLVRGADHLALGTYASARVHPIPTLIMGAAATGFLVWFARRLPTRPPGLRRLIRIAEVVLIVDLVVGFVFGLFSAWLVAALLAAIAALWCLRARDTAEYLL